MYSKTETISKHLNTISSLPSKNSKNQYGSNKDKIAKEFLLMNNDTKNEIRLALNKYTFTNEVFLPTPLRITKKEYMGKNYLLNNLVTFEKNSIKTKKYIEPLNMESKLFNRHYRLIMDENKEHQLHYLNDLTKFYKQKGYKLDGIGNVKEIFNPSFLLDNNFGINIVDDAYRYGYKDYKKDFNIDGTLMNKWNKGISEIKDNRNKSNKDKQEKDINKIFERDNINKKNPELKNEQANLEFNQKVELIKQKLLEENKIRNMNKKQYHKYSSELKEEINKTKKTIDDLTSTNSSLTKSNRAYIKNLPKNVIHKTYKIIHPNHDKNYKQKIVFSTVNKIRNSTEEKLEKHNKKAIPKKIDFFISLDQDKEKNKNKRFLPKIQILTDEEDEKKPKGKKKEEKIIIQKSKKQLKELNDLFYEVSNNKDNFFEKYPNKSVEKYFKKYTKKKLPVLNIRQGSNVHGIFEDFQNIVNNKNFNKVAKSSNDIKKKFENNQNSSFNLPGNKNYFDVDKIQEIDEKIPIMHYIFAEGLMKNKSNDDEE